MGKYDVDRFLTAPDPDLICGICKCVFHEPQVSTCQHVFCKVCIQTWLVKHRSCPNCRQRLSTSRLKSVLPIVRNMINRLLIKCENITNGCTKKVNLEQYTNHFKECNYGLVDCLNLGCTENILRKDMMKHEKKCVHRLVKCKKGCGLPVIVAAMRKHSCIQELKNSMQSMEDSFNKRLKEMEDRFYYDWCEVENRVTSVEHELNDGYRNSHGHSEDSRYRYSSSRSRSPSTSPSRSRSRSQSRSHSESRSPSRSPVYEDDDYPSHDEDYASRSSSLPSERGSLQDSYMNSDQDLDDERSEVWSDDLEERETSFYGSNRDSDDIYDDDDDDDDDEEHPAQVPHTVRTTSSGARTDEAATTSNPTGSESLNNTNDPIQTRRRNQNQECREPNTSSSQSQPELESPESPANRMTTRQSTAVVSPAVLTGHLAADTPMSPPVSQQSGVPINSQGRRPEAQVDEGNGDNGSLEASDDESNSEQPGTSDGRRASAPSTTTQQAKSDSTNRPVVDKVRGVSKTLNSAVTEPNERNLRSRRRHHSPTSSDKSSSSSDSEGSSTLNWHGVRHSKRARKK